MTEQELIREYNLSYDPDDYNDIFQIREEDLPVDELENTIMDVFEFDKNRTFLEELFNERKFRSYNIRERLYYIIYLQDPIEQEWSNLRSAEIDLENRKDEVNEEVDYLSKEMDELESEFDTKIGKIESMTGENYREYRYIHKLTKREDLTFNYDKNMVGEDDIDEINNLRDELEDIKNDYLDMEEQRSNFDQQLSDIEESLTLVTQWMEKLGGYYIT